jgi:hypothetical protein
MKREPTRPDAVNSAGVSVRSAARDLLRDLSSDWRRWGTAERVAARFLLVAALSALSAPFLTALIRTIA